jgi:hypothetical protein
MATFDQALTESALIAIPVLIFLLGLRWFRWLGDNGSKIIPPLQAALVPPIPGGVVPPAGVVPPLQDEAVSPPTNDIPEPTKRVKKTPPQSDVIPPQDQKKTDPLRDQGRQPPEPSRQPPIDSSKNPLDTSNPNRDRSRSPETDPAGRTKNPDGSISNPDGSTTNPDGSITKPDGSKINPDGSTTNPDGSTTNPRDNPHDKKGRPNPPLTPADTVAGSDKDPDEEGNDTEAEDDQSDSGDKPRDDSRKGGPGDGPGPGGGPPPGGPGAGVAAAANDGGKRDTQLFHVVDNVYVKVDTDGDPVDLKISVTPTGENRHYAELTPPATGIPVEVGRADVPPLSAPPLPGAKGLPHGERISDRHTGFGKVEASGHPGDVREIPVNGNRVRPDGVTLEVSSDYTRVYWGSSLMPNSSSTQARPVYLQYRRSQPDENMTGTRTTYHRIRRMSKGKYDKKEK